MRTLGRMMSPTVLKEYVIPGVIASVLGIVLFKWEAIAASLGLPFQIARGSGVVTFEYWIGLAVCVGLGALFPRRLLLCPLLLMMVPELISDPAYLIGVGVPNFYPVVLFFRLLLGVPYIGAAYLGAFLRRRGAQTHAA